MGHNVSEALAKQARDANLQSLHNF